ncbi:DUF983 domain-containing protein [Psychroserpens sp. NJDZ02]|uniref:DUF983 domain-containing protein n=1 Tax=Psychroserpens sp. NJDZ02 TaxID=2570561 RepID=UPI0010A89325|nr:DUF983 domain-containing protein [Psychroserpens sp. NJDZ02]QCE42942.1 DUF983 domain-containing protein [Psychroserpens sp. NJDZ02]
MEFLKGTKINSILTGNCPVCQNESMYTVKNPYKVTRTLTMKERCSHCNTKYKIEPSFFFGAMYVSYPVGIFFGAISFFLTFYVLNLSFMTSYIILIIVMLLLLPIILRISRNIWINIFMTFDKTKALAIKEN